MIARIARLAIGAAATVLVLGLIARASAARVGAVEQGGREHRHHGQPDELGLPADIP